MLGLFASVFSFCEESKGVNSFSSCEEMGVLLVLGKSKAFLDLGAEFS